MDTNDPGKFGEWLKSNLNDVGVKINLAVNEAVTDGAVVMRETIMSTGTKRYPGTRDAWKSAWRGKNSGELRYGTGDARFETGKMVNAVKSAMLESSNTKASGVFGWLNTQEEYFIYQDKGFRHWITGDKIPAMNALRDGYTQAITVVEKRLKEMFR
jgi:hypothetical protein